MIFEVLPFHPEVHVVILVDDLRLLAQMLIIAFLRARLRLAKSLLDLLHPVLKPMKPIIPLALEVTFPLLTIGHGFRRDGSRWFGQYQLEWCDAL